MCVQPPWCRPYIQKSSGCSAEVQWKEADHTTSQLVAGINDKKTFKKPENIQLQQAEYIYSLRNIVKYD